MRLNPNYDEEYRHAIDCSENDIFEARDTAYAWHSGQGSPLYSFASTDLTIQDEAHRACLEADVLGVIDRWGDNGRSDDLPDLENLLAVIRELPVKYLDEK